MNVILQCFVHNPLLRNFYLGDGHQNADCSIKNCLSCAMDDMFQDFYGQEITTGYSASNILACFWLSKRKAYEELASNKEQDAHEFFQFLTEELHEINGGGRLLATDDSQGAKRAKTNHESGCKCIVHQTFYGKSQSTVTCQNCGDINVSVQPFLDLSLGLDSISKKKHLQPTTTLSLQGCLDEEYAKTERCEYTCHSCGTPEAKKSLSIKSLPNVLCIQLKVSSPSTPLTQPLTLFYSALQTTCRNSFEDRYQGVLPPEARDAAIHKPGPEPGYAAELRAGEVLHVRSPERSRPRGESRDWYVTLTEPCL